MMELRDNNKNNIRFKYSFVIYICIFISMCILIFCIPLIDLYFGFYDNSCALNYTGKLMITLKDYLLVSGFMAIVYLTFLISLMINILSSTHFRLGNVDAWNELPNITILNNLVNVLLFIWNIIGGIIFWRLIDTNNCNENIYYYVFITLIIKILFNFLMILGCLKF